MCILVYNKNKIELKGGFAMVLPYIHASRSCTNDPQQDSFVMHTHDNYEIFCFLGGNAEYVVEGNIYPLEVGDVILMRKSEAHHLLLHSAQTYERITINFSFPSF